MELSCIEYCVIFPLGFDGITAGIGQMKLLTGSSQTGIQGETGGQRCVSIHARVRVHADCV